MLVQISLIIIMNLTGVHAPWNHLGHSSIIQDLSVWGLCTGQNSLLTSILEPLGPPWTQKAGRDWTPGPQVAEQGPQSPASHLVSETKYTCKEKKNSNKNFKTILHLKNFAIRRKYGFLRFSNKSHPCIQNSMKLCFHNHTLKAQLRLLYKWIFIFNSKLEL